MVIIKRSRLTVIFTFRFRMFGTMNRTRAAIRIRNMFRFRALTVLQKLLPYWKDLQKIRSKSSENCHSVFELGRLFVENFRSEIQFFVKYSGNPKQWGSNFGELLDYTLLFKNNSVFGNSRLIWCLKLDLNIRVGTLKFSFYNSCFVFGQFVDARANTSLQESVFVDERWYSSKFEPGLYSCFDWTWFWVFNIELRLENESRVGTPILRNLVGIWTAN